MEFYRFELTFKTTCLPIEKKFKAENNITFSSLKMYSQFSVFLQLGRKYVRPKGSNRKYSTKELSSIT